MLLWLTLPFYDVCGFWSVSVNSVYKLQFLWPHYGIGQAIMFSSCGFFFFISSSFFPRLISAIGDWLFTILPHMVWLGLKMCCTRLSSFGIMICMFFDFASLTWKRLLTPQMFFFGGGIWLPKRGPISTKPKRHILARVRVVWAIMRENPSTDLTCRWVPKNG